MSHYSRNTCDQKNAVIDHERKYQEDLEQAKALSLESLALEKYRLEKLRLELTNVQQACLAQNNVCNTNSVSETDSSQGERSQCRSRPRPGSINTNQKSTVILAPPPPIPCRRNSTTTASNQNSSTDLINFTSPVKQDNLAEYCSTPPPPPPKTPIEPKWDTHPSLLKKQTRVSRNNSSVGAYHSKDFRYQSLSPGPRASTAPCTPGTPGISPIMSRASSVSNNVPDIAPQIPPLPMNYRPTVTPAISTPFCTDDEQLNVLKVIEKKPNSNLIDLNTFEQTEDKTNVRVSVLEAFDPLLIKTDNGNNSVQEHKDDLQSQVSGSVYDPFDPFDYMYSTNESVNSDPVYAAVEKSAKSPAVSPAAPPPLPPRNSAAWNTIERRRTSLDRRKRQTRLDENVTFIKTRSSLQDCDLKAFHNMIKSIRSEFPFNNPSTNIGYVVSPMMENLYPDGTSIKLVVHPQLLNNDGEKEPIPSITFTCNVNCSVEHVILNVACSLEDEDTVNVEKYCLRVWGLAEYLAPNTTLAQYEYIHLCIKLEKDIELAIMSRAQIKQSIARTLQDDNCDQSLRLEDILPNEPSQPISYDTLLILLETVEKEMERVETAAFQLATTNQGSTLLPQLQPHGVVQAVKAVCALMGNIETFEITEAVDNFVNACCQFLPQVHTTNIECKKPEIIHEDGDYAVVTLRKKFPDVIASHCHKIRDALQELVETYCHAFKVDFQLNSKAEFSTNTLIATEVIDTILVRVGALHRLPTTWKHDDYIVAAQIFHGTRPVGNPVLSEPMTVSTNLYPRILFNSWLEFRGISVCQVPREARLVLVLYGRTLQPAEHESNSSAENAMQKEELGWGAIQFFDYDGVMSQGSFFLSLWPAMADKRLGPAPAPGIHPRGDTHPIIGVELPDYGGKVLFPNSSELRDYDVESLDFNSLDQNTQELLIDITQQDTFSRPPIDEREILWEKRHYLHDRPEALPKVLLAAHSWDWACLPDLHASLRIWSPLPPVQALQLLLPCFPDMKVREMAVDWIRELSNDELVDYLPQLLQAMKHETYETSPLTRFLLERALLSPRVAHYIYWLLNQALPGQSPQNSGEIAAEDDKAISCARYQRKLQLMLRALLAVIGDALRKSFLTQQLLVKNLHEVAENIKITKESLRIDTLKTGLQNIHCQLMEDNGTCLPLSPSKLVFGINVQTCAYFPSFTLPLKINFISCDNVISPAIFKVGDDLQQDMLTLQMVRIMDKLWLKEGLDLKMVTFACVPTGHKRGMIEMVTNAETLRKIQVEFGLTGSFKDRPIAEWLAKHNPSELEYERAVENFTASCAGYSVATYILGICDRHNDNIMLKTSGHLFHIDFGKFLGDAQMFGNFKRDRTPFVLTSDMAYVINGGDKPSAKFHHFVDLCCQAFNIVRKHGNLILHLFGLMTSSGIPGVTVDAVSYVQKALLPGQTNPEAAATFARMIESSLKSWFTQFNFFLHNLAQMRFSGDHSEGELLSFIPRTYTMQQEGELTSVQVHGYQKRYDPEKYYMYILRIQRKGQPDPTYLFRSYKEFCEFYQKLCIHFPLAKVTSLPSGISVGRSNIKQVADKRRADIEKFLVSLFKMAPEISQSDLVYTFFHPLLRDQKNPDIRLRKVKVGNNWWAEKRVRDNIQSGQIKLALHYVRGTLSVMVCHARGLPKVANAQEPNTYVKVYLKPDPTKATKRKTKVVKKNCHPSFMEMLEYRMPLEVIRERTLEATIWNHDTLQENEFLGGISLPLGRLDLTNETIEWFPLGNVR